MVREAGSCQGTRQPNPQDAASVGPLMEITQITILVCQVRLHLHVFQARKEEWPAKSGHWDKGKLGFYLFSLFFSPLSAALFHCI